LLEGQAHKAQGAFLQTQFLSMGEPGYDIYYFNLVQVPESAT
jgi:hypothetical protein